MPYALDADGEEQEMWGGLPWVSWKKGDGNEVDADGEETLP
jgi:hypothetical protein